MFGPVQGEEMAFAMALFMSAAQGQISAGNRPLTIQNMREGERLFLSLSTSSLEDKNREEVQAALRTPLFKAFILVWEHYRGDEVQRSIGARLLGFYFLMARSRGAILDRWVEPAVSEELILLHPAVIETLAEITLQEDGRLDVGHFLQSVSTASKAYARPAFSSTPSWPIRGGVMAALIREQDWSRTAFGPIVSWPQSLRTSVELMLACKFPMIVLWGDGLLQLYNDGYCHLMGNKHPRGLGQRTRDCWPEVWHINAPIYSRVLQGETLTFEDGLYPITRHGYSEDAYFTLCYSPLSDEAEAIRGILVTVFETTERVIAELAR